MGLVLNDKKIEAIFLNTSTIESGIPDAPVDGNKYGRKNGTWEIIDVDKSYVDDKLSIKADLIHKHKKSDITDFPTNVSSFTNDAGYIISETDPTVPSWAKEPSKPTYNASEVGAIATGGLKTINGESLEGVGNIVIEGGTSINVDDSLSDTSENPVQNKVIKAALDNKQDAGNYATKDELPDISNLATKEELSSKADSTNVYSKSETYTKIETDSAIKQASATVFKYKGAVDNYESLPTEEVSVGDVYSLRDTNGEYVATKASPEPTWEYLGVEVDLSQYSTTVENDGKYQPKGDYVTNSTFTSSLNNKVDKDGNKVLSTNDFTTELKSKLEGIEAGAQVNTVTSVASKTGAVTLTKTDVGLDQVDNTSDLNKPISTATQSALNLKADSTAIADMLTKTEASSTYAIKSDVYTKSETYSTEEMNQKYQPIGNYITYIVIS